MRNVLVKIATLLFIQGAAVAHAANVNVGVTVAGEVAPGVYGRVNIGNAPPPLVYAQPMVIVQQPRPVAPIYMHVPPGHAKHWAKHCHRYNACGQPVYFVKSAEYEPGWQQRPHEREERWHDRDHDRDRDRDHDHDHHDHHGHDHGHGHD